MKTIEELRAEFEKMCNDEGLNTFKISFADDSVRYANDFVNGAWFMFQRLNK